MPSSDVVKRHPNEAYMMTPGMEMSCPNAHTTGRGPNVRGQFPPSCTKDLGKCQRAILIQTARCLRFRYKQIDSILAPVHMTSCIEGAYPSLSHSEGFGIQVYNTLVEMTFIYQKRRDTCLFPDRLLTTFVFCILRPPGVDCSFILFRRSHLHSSVDRC